jgi:predicted transport protein
MVKVEILKQYISDDGKVVYTLTPDFQEIPFVEPATISEAEGERVYTESYHLEGVDEKIISIYEQIKNAVLKIDPKIKVNPQKYYISLKKTKNFAYVEFRKTKMHIVLMLPYETGKDIIKKHKITMLGQNVQDWYGAPCFRVTLENVENLDEIIRALEETLRFTFSSGEAAVGR